jgi:hypothetical protein
MRARSQVLVRYDARRYCAALAAIVAREEHPLPEARVLAARALGHLVRLDWDCARYCLHADHAAAFVKAICSASHPAARVHVNECRHGCRSWPHGERTRRRWAVKGAT